MPALFRLVVLTIAVSATAVTALPVRTATAAASTAGSTASGAGPDGAHAPGRVIVGLLPDATPSAIRAAHAAGRGRVKHHLEKMRLDVVEVPDVATALAAYRDQPGVAYAEPDGVLRAMAPPPDRTYTAQWNLHPPSPANLGTANWEPVYPEVQGEGVLVAVLDSGFRLGGVDQPASVRMDLGFDFVNGDRDATDDNGHGTHIAGTIAQRTGNNPDSSFSVAGIAPLATIMPVKVLDQEGAGPVSATVNGLQYAVDRGAKVLNLSLGGEYSRALCDAVRAVSQRAVVVVASGNEAGRGLVPVGYPAACPGAVAVGGLQHDGSRGSYSNGGCEVALSAPGGDLDVASRLFREGDPRNGVLQETFEQTTGRFGFFFDSGTSMAAAHVAGASALLLSMNLDVGTVESVLRRTARDLGRPGPDDEFGAGALDIASAVAAARGGAVAGVGTSIGYWMVASDGGIFSFGDAPFLGSTGDLRLNQPIVGMARTPNGSGYWLVAADGGIFTFGDAPFLGSTGALRLNRPIVGMIPTVTGNGYWLVASDGGIFTFGDAPFLGSTGALRLNQPIIAMAATRSGNGYWLVAADGGIFNFGAAPFLGSTGALRLKAPIVGLARTPTGAGYWLVASDGGIFAFGDAPFLGSTGALPLNRPIVGMAPTCRGDGYWLVASDGGIFTFGTAPFLGSTGNLALNRPILAMSVAIDHRGAR